jgi:hypothetical protein
MSGKFLAPVESRISGERGIGRISKGFDSHKVQGVYYMTPKAWPWLHIF